MPLCKITVVSHLAAFNIISHFACCKWVDLNLPAMSAPPVDVVTTGIMGISEFLARNMV